MRNPEQTMNLVEFKQNIESFDGSVERFHELFNIGLTILNPSSEWLAQNLSASQSTIEHWKSGKSAPIKELRKLILNTLSRGLK